LLERQQRHDIGLTRFEHAPERRTRKGLEPMLLRVDDPIVGNAETAVETRLDAAIAPRGAGREYLDQEIRRALDGSLGEC
jgi:hypothetical protein